MPNTTFMAHVNKLLRRLNEVEIAQTDFPSVRGVQAMAKDAINASIGTINLQAFEWPFNGTTGTITLSPGIEEYSFPVDFKVPDWESFHIVKDDALGVKTTDLNFISKDVWEKKMRNRDEDAGTDGLSAPRIVAKSKSFGVIFSPSPDKAYTVEYDYWANFIPMVAYDDTSAVPINFDETIIQGGLYHFYMFRDNTQQAIEAKTAFNKMIDQMRTILINSEDTMRSTMIAQGSSVGSPALNSDEFIW